jgi:uncharacterized membrane protein
MIPFSPECLILGVSAATFISHRGIKRKSLSQIGAATAFMVGFLSIACGLRGFVLFMFYQLGTMATKHGKELKMKKDGDAGKSSVRGPSQVLACSAIAVLLSLFHAVYFGEEKTIGRSISTDARHFLRQ